MLALTYRPYEFQLMIKLNRVMIIIIIKEMNKKAERSSIPIYYLAESLVYR